MMKKIKKAAKTVAEPKPEKSGEVRRTKIRVIGLGGGGSSIVSEIASKMKKASFVVANTDVQALRVAPKAISRFQFGLEMTHGLGTGMNAQIGEEAALAAKDKIKKLLEGHDLCILVSCLGGGAGSGALPTFAKISRQLGNITYGIFTLPFNFEGEKKMAIAREAIEKTKNYLNAITVIPNERVFQIIDKNTPLRQALSAINKNLSESLGGLIETIYEPGLINIDFADFRTIMEGRGRLTYLNTVELPRKEDAVKDLIFNVLSSPLYPYTIKGSKGVLFNIAGEKNLSLAEVNQISKTISGLANKEAKIIFGIAQSQKYSDSIKTTLLATGCGMKFLSAESGEKEKKPRKKKITHKKKIVRRRPRKVKKQAPKKKSGGHRIKKKTKEIIKELARNIIGPAKEENGEQNPQTVLVQEKVRKNALQIKQENEDIEKEMVEKEKFWETPAFLRRKTD